jgi:PKD repeat protein
LRVLFVTATPPSPPEHGDSLTANQERLAEAGRELIAARYSWDENAARVLGAWHDVLAEAGRGTPVSAVSAASYLQMEGGPALTRPRTHTHALLSLLVALLVWAAPAGAATGDLGVPGPSEQGSGGAATGQKPESKLWWNDGRWWADMYDSASGTYHIWYLDRSASPEHWVDTGTVLDNRPRSRADTLWDGTHLYVASAIFASSNSSVASGNPTRLYRYSYNPISRSYSLDSGFPVSINNVSSETIVLDKDTTGRLWATWAQNGTVFYNETAPGQDTSWGTPAALPVASANNLDPDDITTLVAYGKPTSQGGTGSHIGVMWSNQVDAKTYFSLHNDGDPINSWSATEAVTIPGPGQSDDHLNVKQLDTDTSGRVWAVIKTSLDDTGAGSSAPQIVVLSRGAQGGWSRATFGTVGDCHTRPVLMLDSTNNLVHVYATAPDSGCPYSGFPGTIFEKTSPMNNLSFTSGRGTPVMRNGASPNLNNVTGSKQTVNAATGIVMLATNDDTNQYWSSDESLGTVTTPTASFSADPTSGPAPLAVRFTDSSTGTPTAWAWDFGDGATAATQNPTHTYAAAGTYVVTLTASNAAGSSTATTTITVAAPPPPGAGITVVGSQAAGTAIANTVVALSSPAGAATNDLLLADFTVDNVASVTPPAGWTRIVGPLQPDDGAEVFAYYHVVGAGETPGSYAWSLSASQRWSGGITVYRGVDTSHPLDVATPSTKTECAAVAGTSITAPGVTTVTAGAFLIGGLGADGRNVNTNPPVGWTEAFDRSDGQMSEHAYKAQSAAGSSGSVTWTTDDGRCLAVWVSALRPGT